VRFGSSRDGSVCVCVCCKHAMLLSHLATKLVKRGDTLGKVWRREKFFEMHLCPLLYWDSIGLTKVQEQYAAKEVSDMEDLIRQSAACTRLRLQILLLRGLLMLDRHSFAQASLVGGQGRQKRTCIVTHDRTVC